MVERHVPLDQRQRALADRAEADHHDRAVEAGVQLVAVGRAGAGFHKGGSRTGRMAGDFRGIHALEARYNQRRGWPGQARP